VEFINEAIAYLSDIFSRGAFGLTYGEITLALIILLFAIFIRGIFARTLVRGLARLADKSTNTYDDALVEAIAVPLKIVPVIIGAYIALQVVHIEGDAALVADNVLQSVVALAVFWTLSRAVNAFEFMFKGLKRTLSPTIVDWMVRAVQFILIVLGFGAVAEIWGIPVAPLIASLGVFGIAIGLAAQDLFKNLIAGTLILAEKRFVPGEWIKVDGVVEGTVERINFRSTLVRRFDKSPVFVPNSKLADNAVTNFSRMTHRRIKWVVGVEYRTTKEQLAYIRDEIEAWLWRDDRFAKPPHAALFVRINAFNDSSIDFLIYTFTNTTNWGEWLAIKEEFAIAVFEIIEASGSAFAFPSNTVYLQQQDAPEIITPPARHSSVAEARKALDPLGTAASRGEDDGG
jgi:MscS family membrane protein